ncbi:amidase [Peribacillus glennii]|uniref:Amidase n=2 Tax=Peribacillus glennii TaxID=2303991 RepID=A0A372LJB3_9BACI|nr:amidase [Peribacillus glennii]
MYLDRIKMFDDQGPKINAIITVNQNAVEAAQELDKERKQKGPRGPLHGIPIIVKDNYDTADMPTTAGCICLKDSIPDDDSHQIKKLKEAGAIILAKSNLHEFAFGITTVSSAGGQTLNPYNLERNPGGSSGGTGAAIAANFAAAGLGTDTGGSIRIPSAFNSLVGIRPTIGLSSRDGIVPLALTQDVGGPMARTVADAAILLEATSGYDPNDTKTAWSVGETEGDYIKSLDRKGLQGAKIGVIRDLFGKQPENVEVNQVTNEAIGDMKKLGAKVIDVKIPELDKILAYPSLSSWEFKFQFNDYLKSLGEDAPFDSLTEVIESGQFHPSSKSSLIARDQVKSLEEEEYKDILLFRTKLTQQSLLKVMADEDLDAFVYPTSSQPAQVIGKGQNSGSANRLSAFSEFPAITVPAGFTSENLPVGIEFLGRAFSEPSLIKLAYAYEQGTEHRKPPSTTP